MFFSPTTFREIVSGRRKGVLAIGFRLVAGAIEPLVRWYATRRNRRFDTDPAAVVRVPAPVISIGNLTVGGVGKTPLVAWVAQSIRDMGRTPVLISRGYGRHARLDDRALNDGDLNDEGLELARRLPDVKHWQNADRVAAAHAALKQVPDAVLVLDDAFQHRRIGRDLDVVILDSLEPFGFDHVLPRGTLREPVEGLARADFVLLSRANLVSEAERQAIRQRVATIAPRAKWGSFTVQPKRLINASGETASLETLAGKRAVAFCGLGNPEGFRRTLAELRMSSLAWNEFPDHHPYSLRDFERIAESAQRERAEAIVCTGKDLAKASGANFRGIPCWAVEIDVEFMEGEREFREGIAGYADTSSVSDSATLD